MPVQRKKTTVGRSVSRQTTRSQRPDGTSAPAAVPWTFLTNHAHVLIVLDSEPEVVLREVALRVGITERAVQRIVQELEEEGYLARERVGRRNRYKISGGMRLRHPVESHCSIDQVLGLISSTPVNRTRRSRKS